MTIMENSNINMLFSLIAFSPLVSALAYPGPIETPAGNVIQFIPQAGAPVPTPGPVVKRDSNSWTFLEAPDENCGYEYGLSTESIGLCDTATCGFATKAGYYGYIYCYEPTTTYSRHTWSSCIGGSSAIVSCLADSACHNNPGILLCTYSSETYCNVGTFIGLNVVPVWCDSTYYSGTVPISTTYVGQVGRALTTVSEDTTPTAPLTTTSPKPTPPSTTTPSPSPSTTTTPQPSPTSPSPSPSPTPTNKSTPIGPIVGGVIGGLALIGGLLALGLFCLKRRRDEDRAGGKEIPETSPQQPHNPSSDKYPAPAGAMYKQPIVQVAPAPAQQTQYQQVPPQPQYPAEKYPTAAGGAFVAPSTQEQRYHAPQQTQQAPAPAVPMQPSQEQQYHAPQQTQPVPAPAPAVAMQPSDQPYQQPPPAVSRFSELQSTSSSPTPQTQNTYYSSPPGAPTFQIAPTTSPSPDPRRESSISSVSAPGSPAPPYARMTAIPDVQEMPGGGEYQQRNEMAAEYQQRTEMDGESRGNTSGRNEMSGDSVYRPPFNY